LLHRHRIIGAALDGGVVAHDHALAPLDARDPGDDAGAVDVVIVHAAGGKRREFEEGGARIDEPHHPVARQQLAALEMPLARTRRSTQRRLRAAMLEFGNERAHLRGVGAEMLGADLRGGDDFRHPALLNHWRHYGAGTWRRKLARISASSRNCDTTAVAHRIVRWTTVGIIRLLLEHDVFPKTGTHFSASCSMTRKTEISAGLLVFRRTPRVEVLLGHPGGPYWARKDEGAWSIPKGLVDADGDLAAAARRELAEETSFIADGPLVPLEPVRQKSGKIVHAFALQAD